MDAERWRRIKEAFQDTFERAPTERAAALEAACGADASIREAVERLLRAHDAAGDYLEQPPPGLEAAPALHGGPEDGAGPAPARIGPFRIERELGRGGMGAVYLAERDDPGLRRMVAIKVVRRGMQTEAVLRRFHNERR